MSIATPDSRGITTMLHSDLPLERQKSNEGKDASTSNWFLSSGSSIIQALRTSAAGVFSATGIRKTNEIVNDTVDSTGSLTDPAELLDSIEEEPKAPLEETETDQKLRSALDETLTEWTLSHVLSAAEHEVEKNAAKLLEVAPEGFDVEQAFAAVCLMDKKEAIKQVTLDAVRLMMEIRLTDGRGEYQAIKAMMNGMEPKTSEITASVKEVLAGILEQGIKANEK